MREESASNALERIENALGRIEAASRHGISAQAELAELKKHHRALRERIEGAISEIDRMLEASDSD